MYVQSVRDRLKQVKMLSMSKHYRSFIENIFAMLERAQRPISSSELRNDTINDGKTYPQYLSFLLDRELLDYISYNQVKEKPIHRHREPFGHEPALIVITNHGKHLLRLWKQLIGELGL